MVSRPVCLCVGVPSGAYDQIFVFCLTIAGSFLTRGLLLGLARAVTLGSKFSRTHGHILLAHMGLTQPGRPGLHIYIPRNRVAQLFPGIALPFPRL
jgi:hypothetical protein